MLAFSHLFERLFAGAVNSKQQRRHLSFVVRFAFCLFSSSKGRWFLHIAFPSHLPLASARLSEPWACCNTWRKWAEGLSALVGVFLSGQLTPQAWDVGKLVNLTSVLCGPKFRHGGRWS